jgi:hypothetical protein
LRQRAWFVADSPNFQTCSLRSREEAVIVAQRCESLRQIIHDNWAIKPQDWEPKCQILLYAYQRAYVTAVGAGSESTLASALIRREKGRTVLLLRRQTPVA